MDINFIDRKKISNDLKQNNQNNQNNKNNKNNQNNQNNIDLKTFYKQELILLIYNQNHNINPAMKSLCNDCIKKNH